MTDLKKHREMLGKLIPSFKTTFDFLKHKHNLTYSEMCGILSFINQLYFMEAYELMKKLKGK